MLFATMIGYTLFYFLRKNFSFAMPGLEQDCGLSKSMLGNFLFAGGLAYGLSKFLNGFIGDRVSPRKMLCSGLLTCSLIGAALGFAPRIAALFAEGPVALAWTFGILFVLSQFFQGTGFPPCAKLIAYWVRPSELATKMSLWNTSQSIGGGLGSRICGLLMGLGVIGAANQGVGMWRWCFWTMAALGVIGAAALWFALPGTPEEEGFGKPAANAATRPEAAGTAAEARPSVVQTVFLNPVIWILGLSNFMINATRALVSDWGPTLLQEAKHFTPTGAGRVIMWFEFAGVAGTLFAGWATDAFFGGRAQRICVFLMALTALALATFWFLPGAGAGRIAGAFALCAAGFCLYGPQALTGVAAVGFCSKSLAGTSIGFLSLFSYIGASAAGKVCGVMAQNTGHWQLPVLTIAGAASLGSVLFLPIWNFNAVRTEPSLPCGTGGGNDSFDDSGRPGNRRGASGTYAKENGYKLEE